MEEEHSIRVFVVTFDVKVVLIILSIDLVNVEDLNVSIVLGTSILHVLVNDLEVLVLIGNNTDVNSERV